MEVASPLPFCSATSGNKRSLACSPLLADNTSIVGLLENTVDEENSLRCSKRRRFHEDTSIDTLSEHFSSHSLILKASNTNNIPAAHGFKRSRKDVANPSYDDYQRNTNERLVNQVKVLKTENEKKDVDFLKLKTEHDRTLKDNLILRRAVAIQQERHNHVEQEIKKVKEDNDERIRRLEQTILSLRYHLQAQRSFHGNDFIHERPPDVF